MNKKDMRELDVWIAEHAFGIEVKRDANGEPYNADRVIGGVVTSWILRYSSKPYSFSDVKREILRRGWSWVATVSAGRCAFAIQGQPTVGRWRGRLSQHVACTEELAGCEAFRMALIKMSISAKLGGVE